MKITYLGNFNDKNFEGLITILRSLKKHFKKYDLSINNINEDTQIVHIHSSGFYESIKYKKIKYKKIYSLHSNINNNPFNLIKDYLDDFSKIDSRKKRIYSKKDKFIKIFMRLLSNFTPIFIKKHFLKKMDLVVLPNKFISNKLKIKNSRIIHQGINIKKFKKIKNKNNKINVRYFGHSASAKGLIETIESFRYLENRYNTEIFLTSLNSKLKKYIEKNSSKTKVHGLTKNIVKEYNISDIIILPYRHTGGAIATPLVLIEAMACECAIITADLPHLREICGNSVLYVKPYSVKDIIKKINYLADNTHLRKTLGKRARKRVVKYYNQETMFKEYERLYNEMINSS